MDEKNSLSRRAGKKWLCGRVLNEMDYLDAFQLDFRPGYGTEIALVALGDNLWWKQDRGTASLLVLLDLSVA